MHLHSWLHIYLFVAALDSQRLGSKRLSGPVTFSLFEDEQGKGGLGIFCCFAVVGGSLGKIHFTLAFGHGETLFLRKLPGHCFFCEALRRGVERTFFLALLDSRAIQSPSGVSLVRFRRAFFHLQGREETAAGVSGISATKHFFFHLAPDHIRGGG